MKMKGNILKELIRPAIHGMRSNDRRKNVCIPFNLIEMEQNIREIADVIRTDNPFKDTCRDGVVTRRKVATT